MSAFSVSATRVRSPLARSDDGGATPDQGEASPAESAYSPSLHGTVPPPAAAPPRTPNSPSETGLDSASSHASGSSGSSAWTRASSVIDSPPPRLNESEAESAPLREAFEPPRLLDTARRRTLRSKRTWRQILLRNAALCEWCERSSGVSRLMSFRPGASRSSPSVIAAVAPLRCPPAANIRNSPAAAAREAHIQLVGAGRDIGTLARHHAARIGSAGRFCQSVVLRFRHRRGLSCCVRSTCRKCLC